MAPFDRPYAISYWSAIVSIALSWTILESFDVEQYRGLEIWVIGHSRSLKIVPFESLCPFTFHSNYGPILYRVWDKAISWLDVCKAGDSRPTCSVGLDYPAGQLTESDYGKNSFRQSLKTFLFATYWCIHRIRGFTTMRYINRLFTYLLTWSKIAVFHTPVRGSPSNCNGVWHGKARIAWLPDGEKGLWPVLSL